MAPAPTATANRPMAKPSKIRYFKGKAPDAARSDSDSEEEEEEQIKPVRRQEQITIDKTVVAGGAGRVIDYGSAKKGKGSDEPKMKVQLRDVKVEGGRVVLPKAANGEESSEYETDEEEEPQAKPKSGVPLPPAGDESSEYETDSEEESEEEVKKPAFRPVFVKKDARNMTQERLQAEAEAKLKEQEEIETQRKIDSKELAGETIRRELAEREAIEVVPDVDDTDGLDPAGEFDAWRARELGRLLRDKQAQAALDEEREEIERRRAMPEAERLKEDMEYAQKTREKEKGQMGFLQKYYHKGAFHQDDELLARDYTGATDSAVDMSLLPKVMQVRDFGKASRTKYTHLVDQDTSAGGWGTAARTGPGGQNGQFAQGCFNCGGPHLRKDCPNNNPNEVNNGMGTSANNSSLGMGGPSRQERFGGDGGNRYREEGRERRFDESRAEQSRDAGYGGGRDREGDRHRGEKRDGESDRKRRRSRSRSRDYEKDRRRPGDDRRRDDRDRDRDRRR